MDLYDKIIEKYMQYNMNWDEEFDKLSHAQVIESIERELDAMSVSEMLRLISEILDD